MIKNIITILFIVIYTTNSYVQTKWKISERGIGYIMIGQSIKKNIVQLNKEFKTRKTKYGTYQVFENDHKIMQIHLIPETDIIGSIRIYSDKWKTQDGFMIGLNIKKINSFCADFFLEYDYLSGSEYFSRKSNTDKRTIKTITKFHFKGTTPDYLGNYHINKETGKYEKSLDNNENGTLYLIEITMIN